MKFKNRLFPMIVCPAWIPELNAVEHGLEGKETFALSPGREGLGCQECVTGGIGDARKATPLTLTAPCFFWSHPVWSEGHPSLPSSPEHPW